MTGPRLRPGIGDIELYVGGRSSVPGRRKIIKLSSNESALGPSPNALKAYRKRLKLARLDDESSASRNPLSKGEASGITGVKPPEQYPREVWDMLIAQGKLRDAGHGLLELTTG